MEKTRKILATEMYASIALSIIIVALYETGVLLTSGFSTYSEVEFVFVSTMEIVTICMIPLALRLFKLKKIEASLLASNGHNLLIWGSIRMAMLCVPMTVNTLLYYLFDFNVAFGYMGIICLICLVFIYPSKTRCAQETGIEK